MKSCKCLCIKLSSDGPAGIWTYSSFRDILENMLDWEFTLPVSARTTMGVSKCDKHSDLLLFLLIQQGFERIRRSIGISLRARLLQRLLWRSSVSAWRAQRSVISTVSAEFREPFWGTETDSQGTQCAANLDYKKKIPGCLAGARPNFFF